MAELTAEAEAEVTEDDSTADEAEDGTEEEAAALLQADDEGATEELGATQVEVDVGATHVEVEVGGGVQVLVVVGSTQVEVVVGATHVEVVVGSTQVEDEVVGLYRVSIVWLHEILGTRTELPSSNHHVSSRVPPFDEWNWLKS